MVQSTLIARVSDQLPLAASVDDEQTETDLSEQKKHAKVIFRRLNEKSEQQCSIENGQYTLHYLIVDGIAYLAIAERNYPRKLAFRYLDEIAKEFHRSYADEATRPGLRPYAFIKFDSFIQRTKPLYQDSRNVAAQNSGLNRLNDDLQDVTKIMTKNMEDLLWRGDSLDKMSHMSSSLRDESIKYRKAARDVNLQAMYRKWAPVALLGLLVLVVIWWRFL